MNSKEIIKKSIKLEKTPRVPVTLLSGGVWTFNRKGMPLNECVKISPDSAAEIIIKANEEVRSDIVWAAGGCNNFGLHAIGGKVNFRKRGALDVDQPMVQSVSEIDKIDLKKLEEHEDINRLLEITRILVKEIGGSTMIAISQWAPLTLAGHVYGIDKVMRSVIKDKPAVHALLEFTTELCARYLELFLDAGAEMTSFADPSASGDLISRGQFKEFALPYHQKVIERIKKKKDVPKMVHICGDITKFLDLIPETGVDVVSLDYKVDLGKAREVLDGKIAFTGNMNPVAVMQDSTHDEVGRKCGECIGQAGTKGGFILMPGCDIPPDVPLDNLKAMVDTAHSCEM